MAVPHYAYLKMEMPGPKGIITVAGDFRRSIECARASSQLAEALIIAEELEEIKRKVDFAQQNLEKAQRTTSESSFQPDKDAKKIRLDEAHLDRIVIIGTGLDSK